SPTRSTSTTTWPGRALGGSTSRTDARPGPLIRNARTPKPPRPEGSERRHPVGAPRTYLLMRRIGNRRNHSPHLPGDRGPATHPPSRGASLCPSGKGQPRDRREDGPVSSGRGHERANDGEVD